MVEWVISSSVLIAVVILLRFILKGKLSLRLQYALWALVLVRLLVPVSFGGSAMSVENLTQKAADTQAVRFVSALSETELPRMSYQAAYNQVAEEYAEKGIQIEELPLEQYAETVDYEIMNKMNGDLSIAEVAQIIWFSGIALVGIWFVISNLRLLRSLKRTRSLLTGDRTLPVYVSGAIDTPCLFGLFHPAIYLTGEAAENEITMRHAVEHELTHYHHKDNIWAILRSVCLAVHWYNPLVWWAAVLSRNDAELACDESTILRLGESERAAYGRTLISLTFEKRPALLHTATTMTGSGRSIKERIALIVKKPKMALYTVIAVVVIAAVAVGCTFTGAKETDTPWSWAQSLTAEDITTSVILWNGDGDRATLTDEETAELVRLLNALEDGDFTENSQLAGSTPAYGLTIQTSSGEYNINESIAPSGSLEINYGNKEWWIDDDALTKFIRELPVEADPRSAIAVVVEQGTPQAVIDCAMDYVQQQIDYHNELGASRPEGAEYSIIKANISKIEQVNTGTAGLNDGVALYQLEYRLQPDHPENVVMAGGMSVESGWLTEWNSAGQPYLLLHYDDSGDETVWTPICVTNTDIIGQDYGTPEMLERYGNKYTAAAMELYAQYLNDDSVGADAERERWESEIALEGFSVQAEGSYAEIGQQWAQAYVSQYTDGVSEDHPLRSTDRAVLNCKLSAESLLSAPKKLIFNMGFVCLAADKDSFENWYAGWAGPLTDEAYPQYAGWMSFGWAVVLEQTGDGQWTCTGAGTGGYGGWGYLNYEEAVDVDFLIEHLLNGGDILAENVIRILPFIDWAAFEREWGMEGWNALWSMLDGCCLSAGQVYGPEETRMWSDVYPDDQAYRNLYVMLAAQNSDGAYTAGLTDILRKQREHDPALFDACLQQLTQEQQKNLQELIDT